MHHWEGISNPVLLLLPKGAEWNVKWKKLDADIWLIDEWKKFAEFCSLDQEHLLVFKYVGKSRFQVVTFDQNGLEMQYPLIRDMGREIICESSRNKPGKRSRLWFQKDVLDVLTKNTVSTFFT